jgi:RNA polymerase sigma-70 factor (ECF subfamily)
VENGGMTDQPERQLEHYVPLMHRMVREVRLDRRLRRRFEPADLVQEALLKAHANRTVFQGTTEAEWVGWLREILASTLIDAVRKARARKRDVAVEVPLQDVLAEPTARLESFFISRVTSPSQAAEHRELAGRLAQAIEQLPAAQREVVFLRDLMQEDVPEIARRLRRTRKSVAGLLLRGRRRLRRLLGY